MGEDCGTWLPRPRFDRQPSYLTSLGLCLSPGNQNLTENSLGHNPIPLMRDTTFPQYASNELHPLGKGKVSYYHGPKLASYEEEHQLKLSDGRPNDLHGLHHVPCFRHVFQPTSDAVLADKRAACRGKICGHCTPPNRGAGGEQNRFLVVDQCGYQTTVFFNSGAGTPLHCPPCWSQKPSSAYDLFRENPESNRNSNQLLEPASAFDINGNHEHFLESEMHEDTEELNALLYSDDQTDSYEDDEVISTGHSPSTVAANDRQDWLEGSEEEIGSSYRPTKRQKFDGDYDNDPSLVDTASSLKTNTPCDGAEPSFGDQLEQDSKEVSSMSSSKKMRTDKIRETVSILQSIVPGSNGKEAVAVLDMAIQYLKMLKLRAKALGIDSP